MTSLKWHKVQALFLQDLLIYRRVGARLAEFIYFPITNLLIFGLLSRQLDQAGQASAQQAGLLLIIVQVIWNFAYLAQSTVNLQTMEDIWSGSLRQLLLTGITEWELLAARVASSSLASLLVLAAMLATCVGVLGEWGVLAAPAQLAALIALTLVASLGLAVIVAGVIVLGGRQYGLLSWTVTQGFVLLSLPFVPAQLPDWLWLLSLPMPFTGVFVGARELAAGQAVSSQAWLMAAAAAVGYVAVGLPFYGWAFRYGRRTGVLAGLG